ncbi:MAG TPA: hypothetical protein VGX03_00675 [Candidatus Binatia bacterium]|jgi:uncharacterized membrane protein YfcA|nr:hypothetical protein [Candidatus Binatia bacterium]
MKNKAGLVVPVILILVGIYTLFTTLGSSGEVVVLMSDHQIPRGLGFVLGLLGLGGGTIIMLTALSNRKHTSE